MKSPSDLLTEAFGATGSSDIPAWISPTEGRKSCRTKEREGAAASLKDPEHTELKLLFGTIIDCVTHSSKNIAKSGHITRLLLKHLKPAFFIIKTWQHFVLFEPVTINLNLMCKANFTAAFRLYELHFRCFLSCFYSFKEIFI